MSEVANPSSTPALIALNIFYAITLEKWITCVNVDSCTLLFDMHMQSCFIMYPVHLCFYPLFILGLLPLADKLSNTSCCTNMSLSLCISHTDWFLSMKPETSKADNDVYSLRSLNKGVCVCVCMSGQVIFFASVLMWIFTVCLWCHWKAGSQSSVNCGW